METEILKFLWKISRFLKLLKIRVFSHLEIVLRFSIKTMKNI